MYSVFKKAFDSEQKDEAFIKKENEYAPFFAELLAYYISDRYPSYREKLSHTIRKEKAEEVLKKSREVFTWLESLRKL
ncbi:HEPN domain-containing protein [Virgibacillus oceani]